MSNTAFNVPVLLNNGAWIDLRGRHKGGYGWRGDRALSNIKRVILHHTVTDRRGNALADIDYLKKLHIDVNGWGGIGYHIVITSEEVNGFAKVAYVGDIGSIRAHAVNSKGAYGITKNQGNVYSVGISIIGQLQLYDPTEAQLRSLYEVCKELIFNENGRLTGLPDDYSRSIGWHRDMDSTVCPVKVDLLWNRIVNDWRPQTPEIPEWKRNAVVYKKQFVMQQDAILYNITNNGVVQTYSELVEGKPRLVDVSYLTYVGNKQYYLTEYSYNNNIPNGFLKENLEYVKPEPELPTEPEQPISEDPGTSPEEPEMPGLTFGQMVVNLIRQILYFFSNIKK